MKKKGNCLLKEVIKDVDTVVFVDHTIAEAVADLRKHHRESKIIYFYVVDEKKRLIGVVSTRDLLLSTPDTKISTIMDTRVISLYEDQTLKDAIEIFAQQNLLAIPVVDREGVLQGIVDVEMYLEETQDIAKARHRIEIFQLIGLSLEDENKLSIWKDYHQRMPWIFCNFVSGFVCVLISSWNEAILAKMLVLALFIPLVLTVSESISMQSMTHSLHFLRRANISLKDSFFRIVKDSGVVTVMAMTAAIIIGGISFLWQKQHYLSLTMASGVFIAIMGAALLGSIFPLMLYRKKMDPKFASGPLVLMCVDIWTMAVYLFLATWWLL